VKADPLGRRRFSLLGGIVKAEGLGDGLTHEKAAIANPSPGSGESLRLTMPPSMLADFALALVQQRIGLACLEGEDHTKTSVR
jgi:hypothetical protein